jgi:CheY-like chemotaxis protein
MAIMIGSAYCHYVSPPSDNEAGISLSRTGFYGMVTEFPRVSVLVVEDEPLILDIVADELNDAGFNVLQATTGEEAVAILNTVPLIDLLLTDIRLPGSVDGWGVAEHAREIFRTLPVIYVTGYSGKPVRQVPDSILLMKPYRPSAVVKAAKVLGVAPDRRDLE